MNDLNSETELSTVDSTEVERLDPTSSVQACELGDSRADEFEPPIDPPIGNDSPDEHWLNRLRVVLWIQDQTIIAGLLFVCLLFMAAYFSAHWYVNQGLVDIDQAAPLKAEFKVDINSAELGEIVLLPGVGRKLAQAIIDHRAVSGKFESIDQLCDVPGIGKKTLESMKQYLRPIRPVDAGLKLR